MYHVAFCPLALEAVIGPGSRGPRSLDLSGDALAGTWVAGLVA
jgi:hypothetical protein